MSALEWVGAIVLCLIALAAMLLAAAVAFAMIERRLQKRRDVAGDLAVRRFCDSLHAASYWFGEDEATATLLREFSRPNVGHDISQLREEWRRRRAGIVKAHDFTYGPV